MHKRNPDNVWVRYPRPRAESDLHLEFSHPADLAGARLADLIEVQRQAGIFYVHSRLGVPEGDAFVLSSISLERSSWSFERPHDLAAEGGAVVVREGVGDHEVPTRSPSIRLTFDLMANSGAATGAAAVRVISRRAYERVRRLTAPEPQDVESNWDYAGPIFVDESDPLVTDHSTDHMSAMAVIVSIEQSVLSLGADRVDALSAEFRAYIEEGEGAVCRLSFGADGAFAGAVSQAASVCATFTGRAVVQPEGSLA
ncbi:hypothetical protein [Microbacterium neimengense]